MGEKGFQGGSKCSSQPRQWQWWGSYQDGVKSGKVIDSVSRLPYFCINLDLAKSLSLLTVEASKRNKPTCQESPLSTLSCPLHAVFTPMSLYVHCMDMLGEHVGIWCHKILASQWLFSTQQFIKPLRISHKHRIRFDHSHSPVPLLTSPRSTPAPQHDLSLWTSLSIVIFTS